MNGIKQTIEIIIYMQLFRLYNINFTYILQRKEHWR